MKIVQVDLMHEPTAEVLTTWVDNRPDLKPGVHITLKDFKPEMSWRVVTLYTKEHEAADFDFHRKWDNNNYDKHEGLKL